MLHLLAKIFFSSIQIKVIDVRLLWTFIMHFILRREWGRREVKEGNIYIPKYIHACACSHIHVYGLLYIIYLFFILQSLN